jgi:hypothetical protein
MMHTATGTFDVKLTPLDIAGETLGRMHIDKRFHGPLEGESVGQMLSAGTATKGSAVYVALERVHGTLDGRRGSFVLYHTGVMDRGAATLSVAVCPDSGTDQLAGLSGTMTIAVGGGEHRYTFEYVLAAASA